MRSILTCLAFLLPGSLISFDVFRYAYIPLKREGYSCSDLWKLTSCNDFNTGIFKQSNTDLQNTVNSEHKAFFAENNHSSKSCTRSCDGVSLDCWVRTTLIRSQDTRPGAHVSSHRKGWAKSQIYTAPSAKM